jgi:citrate lyase alpha subunit
MERHITLPLTREEARTIKSGEQLLLAERTSGVPKKPALGDRIVANVIYRDGTVIDTIKQVAD